MMENKFWNAKTVLVTGSDGFAGSHMCEALARNGANIRAFVRTSDLKNRLEINNITYVTGDVLDYQSLVNSMKNVDVVYHFAAITLIPETRAMMSNTFLVNAGGTLNLLLAAKESGVKKIVYISTCHVYGNQDKMPIYEDTPPKPLDIYSASKLAGEHLCSSFADMFGMDISMSRAFNHFGPRQRSEFLIPSVITRLIKEKTLQLGNPEPTRDYMYITDVVNGYLLLGEKGGSGEVYNFAWGIERTVKSIVEKIIEIGGFDAEVIWNPSSRKVDIKRSVGDYSKAKKDLSWEPRVSFEEGIEKTIQWYLSHAGSNSSN